MEYLFILGRNKELSIAELKCFLKSQNVPIKKEFGIENSIFIEVNDELKKSFVDELGGTIAIGVVLTKDKRENILNKLDKIEIYSGEKNNINYCLWELSGEFQMIRDYLKSRFKKEKLKASIKQLDSEVLLQSGESFYKPSSKFIDEEYFIFEKNEEIYFGKIIQKCDYKKIEERDIKKPVRRQELAISPRLAKIMINLSGVKEGQTLLDPFCGVGTILQEALLKNIKVIGIDNDKSAVEGAKKNLRWFGFAKENYQLFNLDSRFAKISESEAIVCEPDLGSILKKIPSREDARKILTKFENLMIDTINNLKKYISGKIIFSSPFILIGKERICCNIEKICKCTKTNLILGQFEEYRPEQIVGRKIFALE
jgi:tRNA G10  N-methylase Trm11